MTQPENEIDRGESPSRTLASPDPETARDHVAAAIERGDVATLWGRCTVEYDGRAASYLGPGDRLVVLKPDGTLLVHTTTGQQPANWQPPGSTHEPSVSNDRLRIVSRRSTPEEELTVEFQRVEHLAAFDGVDEQDVALAGTEADLRQRILDDPALVEAGFRPLATERDTAAGAVDVYGEDAAGTPVVLELKRRRVGPEAVGQLDRYVAALHRDLPAGAAVRGILVAPSLTDRAHALLDERDLEFVSLSPGRG